MDTAISYYFKNGSDLCLYQCSYTDNEFQDKHPKAVLNNLANTTIYISATVSFVYMLVDL